MSLTLACGNEFISEVLSASSCWCLLCTSVTKRSKLCIIALSRAVVILNFMQLDRKGPAVILGKVVQNEINLRTSV